MSPLSLTASVVSVVYIVAALRYLRRTGRISFFHIVSMSLVLTNGVGLAFAEKSKAVVDFGGMSDVAIFRASVSTLLFCLITYALGRFFYSSKMFGLTRHKGPRGYERIVGIRPFALIGLVIMMLAILAAAARFLIISGAYTYVGEAFLRPMNQEHYEIRSEILTLYFGAGKGAYAAMVAMYIIAPVVISLLVYLWIRLRSYTALIGLGVIWVVQLVLALVFAQRSPLLFCMVQPFAAWAIIKNAHRLRSLFEQKLLKVYLALALLVTTGGAVVYQLTDNIDFIEGVGALYSRVFLVPIAASGFIYDIFPDTVAFRGLVNSVNMGDESLSSEDINFGDVSYIMTGYRFDANSCLIAVGYSGFGYVGVAVVSLVFFIYCWLIDQLAGEYETESQAIALSSSLYTLVAIANVPLYTAVLIYGFGVTAAIAAVFYRFGIRRAPATQASRLRSGPASTTCIPAPRESIAATG